MSKFKFNFSCLSGLVMLLLLSGACSEDSYGPVRSSSAESSAPRAMLPSEPELPEPATSNSPVLVVGDVTMPMPVPDGFKRLPADHPLAKAAQLNAGSDEVLLCVFERGDSGGISRESFWEHEMLLVSTLSKWLQLEVSAAEFQKLKEPWEKDSVKFTQTALENFSKSAKGKLAESEEFSYNLGLVDSSPLHISFLQIHKYSSPAGQSMYICNNTSLLWRYGKILCITYNKRIEEFGHIHGVVAESVAYLQKLQNIDSKTDLPLPSNATGA